MLQPQAARKQEHSDTDMSALRKKKPRPQQEHNMVFPVIQWSDNKSTPGMQSHSHAATPDR